VGVQLRAVRLDQLPVGAFVAALGAIEEVLLVMDPNRAHP
jgi:hypothetical protein